MLTCPWLQQGLRLRETKEANRIKNWVGEGYFLSKKSKTETWRLIAGCNKNTDISRYKRLNKRQQKHVFEKPTEVLQSDNLSEFAIILRSSTLDKIRLFA